MQIPELTSIDDEPIETRESRDPIRLATATTQADELISQWQLDHIRDAETFRDLSKCCDCGREMPKPYVKMYGPLAVTFIRCNSCIPIKIEAEKAEALKSFDEICGKWCPPEFNTPWDTARGNNVLRDEVFRRFSFSTKKGLLIFGRSGSCKTRVIWELLKHIHQVAAEEARFLFLDSFDMATKGIPVDAYNVPLLVIDDLGNEPLGPKNEKHLLHLIRKRCDWFRPIIVTTQLDAETFKKSFFYGPTGEAALRRFRERSEVISVGGVAAKGVKTEAA